VITVAGVLVIAKGVVKAGVIARVTWWLLATVTTAAQALRRLIVPVGVASALMNTTPLVAMLIPAARQLQPTRDVPAREVLLPVAHATTLAGEAP
jgi:Na+/H+ antiporter NhaD/arsenite permease-like protein